MVFADRHPLRLAHSVRSAPPTASRGRKASGAHSVTSHRFAGEESLRCSLRYLPPLRGGGKPQVLTPLPPTASRGRTVPYAAPFFLSSSSTSENSASTTLSSFFASPPPAPGWPSPLCPCACCALYMASPSFIEACASACVFCWI